jgi:predicted DsbA family dithiol-disulfide isomerase
MKGKDVEVEWKPFELRPYPAPTLDPNGEYIQTGWRQSVYPLAQKLGVEMNLPPVQPHTHLAFEGFQYAKSRGLANEYNHRMFEAFFVEGKDLGEIDVLTELAGEVGLDRDEYREAVESRRFKEAHQQALKEAGEQNITAVPTFFIGDQKLQGLYPADRLEAIIKSELEKQSDDDTDMNGISCGIDGC